MHLARLLRSVAELAAVCLPIALWTIAVDASARSVRVHGQIEDELGALVPEASVSVTDAAGVLATSVTADSFGAYSLTLVVPPAGVEEGQALSGTTAMIPSRLYPNPFNTSTAIEFSVMEAGPCLVAVYDILGQRVATLLDQVLDAGRYQVMWGGLDEQLRATASGRYVCSIETPKLSEASVLVKQGDGGTSAGGLRLLAQASSRPARNMATGASPVYTFRITKLGEILPLEEEVEISDDQDSIQKDFVVTRMAALVVSLPGGVPLTLVKIPAGSFQMGSDDVPEWSLCYPCEQPVHTVNIAYDFWIGLTEVTQAQWQAVMDGTNLKTILERALWALRAEGVPESVREQLRPLINHELVEEDTLLALIEAAIGEESASEYGALILEHATNSPIEYLGEHHPVNYVTWTEWTTIFLDILNNLSVVEGTFRLPTEAEWEYACRGTSLNPHRYSQCYFGDLLECTPPIAGQYSDFEPCDKLGRYAWWGSTKGDPQGPKPVAALLPNDFGLHDTYGNVFEWCQDRWNNNYEGAPADGSAWEESSWDPDLRVIRGGCWAYGPDQCRSSWRSKQVASTRYCVTGARLVFIPAGSGIW